MANAETAVGASRASDRALAAKARTPISWPWEPSFFRHVQLAFLLRRFATKYFAQLDVEYESLCPDSYKADRADELAELRECNVRQPSWKLNHRLEYLLLGGLPPPILKQRALVHRARLLALVGLEGQDAFAAAFPQLPEDSNDIEAVRTAALGVLQEIQRLRQVRSEFERLRNRLVAISMIPGFAFVGLALRFSARFWEMPAVEVAAILGLLGGYLSVLLRIGSLRWALGYAANYQQVDRLFWNLFLNFYLSLLEGSLGAIVLFIAFSAGVVTSSAFPTIPADGHAVVWTMQLTHQDAARLMLWCIVAGFSERAIPDFLSGLGKDLTRKTGPNAPSEQPAVPVPR